MLQKLRDFFTSLGSKNFEQQHNEAIVQMLVWMMHSDGNIDPNESDKLDDFLASVNWQSEANEKQFVALATQKVKQIETGERTEEDLMAEISAKLKGQEIRYTAVKVCHELAKADNFMDKAEVHLFKVFSKSLLK